MRAPRKLTCARAPTAAVVLRFLAATFVLIAHAAQTEAADARLRWLASPEADVEGYRVYVREAARSYGTGIDVARPPTGADGALAYVLTGFDPTVTYFVAVSAYNAENLESALSNELSLGAPNPGTCAGLADRVLGVDRLRFRRSADRTKIAAKARFAESALFEPAVTGLRLLVSDDTGASLTEVTLAPSDLIPNGDGSVLKTVQKRGTNAPVELQRFSLRTRAGNTYLTVRIAVRPTMTLPSSAGLTLQSGQLCLSGQPPDCSSNGRRLSCR